MKNQNITVNTNSLQDKIESKENIYSETNLQYITLGKNIHPKNNDYFLANKLETTKYKVKTSTSMADRQLSHK